MNLQLRRLEAYGFKSFADRVEIEFGQGITAIVGPNGSGKSNITDAIKWVLGEQNIRNLRGTKTEDIIFAGSKTRRALGLAEVSLIFDNTRGDLPLDFNEVTITRRLFRSGESEYYINKVQCRLKDIHELFADTGIGRDAMSVISQNKVDQVLNSKPEDRRMLFEEAASITKYRNRKKESLNKLETTDKNIMRVSDIIQEIENQLEPLALSAEKTKKYNELAVRVKNDKISILTNNYDKYALFLIDSNKKKEFASRQEADIATQINLSEVKKEQFNNELIEVEKSLQLLLNKNHEINSKIEKQNNDVIMYEERVKQEQRDQIRISNELNSFKNQNTTIENKIRENIDENNVLQKKLFEIRKFLCNQNNKVLEYDEEIKKVQNDIAKIQEESLKQMQALLSMRAKAEIINRDIKQLDQEKIEMKEKENLEKSNLQNAEQYYEKYYIDVRKIRTDIFNCDKKKQELKQKTSNLNKSLHCVTSKITVESDKLNNDKARIKLLRGLQLEYEGLGRGVRSVLTSKNPWRNGVCGVVAELIHVPSKYITAIEIALGASLQNIITESDIIAKQAIEYLKKENLGRVTFLPLNTVSYVNKFFDEEKIRAKDGFIGYANELVEYESKYDKIIKLLLSRIIIVSNIDVALKLAKEQKQKLKIVTLDGEIINPGGSMTGGSMRRDVSFLNRASEIEKMEKNILLEQEQLKIDLVNKNDTKEQLDKLTIDMLKIVDSEQQLKVREAELNIYIKKCEEDVDRHKKILEDIEKAVGGLNINSNLLRKQLLKVNSQLVQLETNDMLQKNDESGAKKLKELNEARSCLLTQIMESKVKETTVEQDKMYHDVKLTELKDTLLKNNEKVQSLLLETKGITENLSKFECLLRGIKQELAKLNQLKAIGEKDYSNFQEVKLNKLADMQKNDNEIKELRRKYAGIQSRLHEIEIVYNKYLFEANKCIEELKNTYSLSIEEAKASRREESNENIIKEMKWIESEIEKLGTINPNAIEEYKTLNQRYQFMTNQSEDLIRAKEYLVNIIAEIDKTMIKQFKDAFKKINEYFSEIFVKLFGGGQADLTLLEENGILDSGIDIHVQPPGKKMQNLSMLSGGERALTVIALLFAFLRFKPAPFTVVDEIDAPLDEANIGRFGVFLKEYAHDTQFIIVTHRKGTMESADVMHGVTVEDSGVSKIVSVKMNDIEI